MRAKTPEEIEEIRKLRQELKAVRKELAEEILDHRIDMATLEMASEIYHFDPVAIKKGDVVKSGMGRALKLRGDGEDAVATHVLVVIQDFATLSN